MTPLLRYVYMSIPLDFSDGPDYLDNPELMEKGTRRRMVRAGKFSNELRCLISPPGGSISSRLLLLLGDYRAFKDVLSSSLSLCFLGILGTPREL